MLPRSVIRINGIRHHLIPIPLFKAPKMFFPKTLLEIRINEMNRTFEAPRNVKLTQATKERVQDFSKVVTEECTEITDCICPESGEVNMVAFADVLGDICVYCFSEARRHGIPLTDVIHLILDSQESKLVDGKPLWNEERTKFIKGPNYKPPDEAIHNLLYNSKTPVESPNPSPEETEGLLTFIQIAYGMIPEGYSLSRLGSPNEGELFIHPNGDVHVALNDYLGTGHVIVVQETNLEDTPKLGELGDYDEEFDK